MGSAWLLAELWHQKEKTVSTLIHKLNSRAGEVDASTVKRKFTWLIQLRAQTAVGSDKHFKQILQMYKS